MCRFVTMDCMSLYSLRPIPDIDANQLAPYSALTKRLLLARNITTEQEAEIFLHPNWERDIHDPFLMKDMQKVVDRIMTAIAKKETIVLWSDYDMDGIPGAVLLNDFFRRIGYDYVIHHTPHRNRDGFGLNAEGIDELIEKKAGLIVTIDCGIADVEHVAYAQKNGIDVIVTDHHLVGMEIPKACAILNPKQDGCSYPEKMLCGAGVAFKLVQALIIHLRAHAEESMETIPVGWEKWQLDMAGMATIADMVHLSGENRTLAYFGLMVLRKSRRVGLQALLKKARTNQKYLIEDDVAFTIAPRINAASRMGHAKDAFALLSSTDLREAGALAETLDAINTERKTVVATMKREVHRKLKKIENLKSVIVLGNPEWKPSLLGLVAGSLAEEYKRPVFLWGRESGTTIKGSCRSDGSCSIFALMEKAHESFLEYGGHTIAGGFSLEEEQVHTLEEKLSQAYALVSQKDASLDTYYDEELTLDQVNWDTYREVSSFGPFGEGNPKPLFFFRAVSIRTVKTFGKGNEHLEFKFKREHGGDITAISFFTEADSFGCSFHSETPVSFVAHLEASYFKGRPELRLKLVDIFHS